MTDPTAVIHQLRRAFDATMRGPAYLAEAAKTQIDSVLRAGEEAQFATMIANMPAAVAERAKKILDVK